METLNYSEIVRLFGCENEKEDFAITGISTDTRTIKSGDLFVALNGANFRGADFVDVAVKKGAVAVIASDEVDADIPFILVEDSLAAYQKLAAYYRNKFDIPIVAITGSNGKTTTRNMLYTILSAKYRTLTPEKNYNNGIGLPYTLFQLDNSYECAVLELGMNHLGEIDLLTRLVRPSVAVITNVGKAHIGLLGSQENIKKAKLEIVNGLDENGLLILNGDDDHLKDVAFDNIRVDFIGNKNGSKLSAKDIVIGDASTSFIICSNDGASLKCTLPIVGTHNVYNALEAIYASMQFGFTLEEACNALTHYEAVSMRSEISYDKGVAIIKDYYNASPESMAAALKTIVSFGKSGKKIAILGQMHELGEFSADEHEKLARLCVESGLDYVFFIGKDHEAFSSGLGSKGICFPAENRREMMESLLSYVREDGLGYNDVVLIKGSRASAMEEFYESLKVYINSVRTDFTTLPPSPTRLYVDINAMKYNFFQISRSLEENVEIMPMIKANAYGCGVDVIANVFKECRYLAVADVKEAALIRRILPDVNIMIIYQPVIDDVKEIVSGGYVAAVGDLNFAKALNDLAAEKNVKCKVHIEVDTGAARLGIAPRDAVSFAKEVANMQNLEVDGIFMHYICADSFTESDLEFTALQSERFAKAVGDIESVLGTVRYKHACAGAAIFNKNAVHYNMVRPGMMLYGYYPSAALKEKVELKPALKFASVILKIAEHEKDTPVSYNRRAYTQRKTKIATVAVGYSDGVFRKLFHPNSEKSGCFVVNGQRAPIIGSICMDLTMIDITDINGDVNVGDEVFIFDNCNVTVEEMADLCDTINYEIIARIEDKADRVESF